MTSPEPETRSFHLGDILSITTGTFLAVNGVDGVYDLLGYMTGEEPMIHQLPRFGEECRGALLEQLPFLATITFPEGLSGEGAVRAWIAEQIAKHGEMHPVTPMAAENHTRINPLLELIQKREKTR